MAQAKLPNVLPRKELLNSDDIKLDDQTVNLDAVKTEGVIEQIIPGDKSLGEIAQNESFYRDVLDIHWAEPATESESPFVEAHVAGYNYIARRGESKPCPRYVLEVIARSKVMRVRTERQIDSEGAETMVPRISYSPCYPFSVLADPAGAKGLAWLKQVMSQPG